MATHDDSSLSAECLASLVNPRIACAQPSPPVDGSTSGPASPQPDRTKVSNSSRPRSDCMTSAQLLTYLDNAVRQHRASDVRVNIDPIYIGLDPKGCSLMSDARGDAIGHYGTIVHGHLSIPLAHPVDANMNRSMIAVVHLYGTSVRPSSLPRLEDVRSGLEPWLALATRAAVVLDELCVTGVTVKRDDATGLSYLDFTTGGCIDDSKFADEVAAFGRDLVAGATERLLLDGRFAHDDLVDLIEAIPHGSLVLDSGYYDLIIQEDGSCRLKSKRALHYRDKYADIAAAGTAHVMLVDEREAGCLDA
ncbi:hypothetical protein ml_28 [Mollivirus sibericum]|uniref:hypothetical protein n=1 Tax=Mollivirus sibericum TaxID=1678078 RepID=UPI0006B2DFEF|nr:hypothetical protein ml_28 [Mollivirus sibericum]ALD61830.1 hypothetical protein ml_28 [Mollivirus sibericum]